MKLDTQVFIIIRKIIDNNHEEYLLDVFDECFTNYDEAARYLRTHYRARKVNKQDKFVTESFIYYIRRVPIIKEYREDLDQIILREMEE